MAIDRVLHEDADRRQKADAVKKLLAAMPTGATRARVRFVCCECGRVWAAKVDARDKCAPEAFETALGNLQHHGRVHGHRHVDLTVEPL